MDSLNRLAYIMFFALCVSTVPADAQTFGSDETALFRSDRLGLEFQHPRSMVAESNTPRGVVVSLRPSSDRPFPTFNITRVPRSTQTLTPDKAARELASEYRGIGFSRVAVRRAFDTSFPGSDSPAPVVQLGYETQGRELEALVGIVPRDDAFFVLTYIDYRDAYEDNAVWRRMIFKSFSLGRSFSGVQGRGGEELRARGNFGGGRSQRGAGEDLSSIADIFAWFGGSQTGFSLIGILLAIAGFFGLRRPGKSIDPR